MEMYKIQIISFSHSECYKCAEFIMSPFIPRVGEKINIPWVCVEESEYNKLGSIDRDSYDEVIEVIYNYDDNNNFYGVTICIETAPQ